MRAISIQSIPFFQIKNVFMDFSREKNIKKKNYSGENSRVLRDNICEWYYKKIIKL